MYLPVKCICRCLYTCILLSDCKQMYIYLCLYHITARIYELQHVMLPRICFSTWYIYAIKWIHVRIYSSVDCIMGKTSIQQHSTIIINNILLTIVLYISITLCRGVGRGGNCPPFFPGKAKKQRFLNDCCTQIKYIYDSLLYSKTFYSPKS